MALAATGPSALWYLTRATGAVTLVLLTASVALGVANVGRLQSARWPRFVVEGLHRNVSLLAIAVLMVHIVTTLLDPFASIHLLDALIPFVSVYRPFWLGLGAFASDLLLAIAITSMVRRRLGHRAWRVTHWFAYASWPIALLHAAGTGSDIKQLWMQALLAGCLVAVVAAVWTRVGIGWPQRRALRGSAVAVSIALPVALVFWLPGGPLASDWASRAGTPPVATTAAAATAATGSLSSPISAFSARVNGIVSQRPISGGGVEVDLSLSVVNAPLGTVHVRIDGNVVSGSGVQMTASSVSIGTLSSPTLYQGAITSLDGTQISARVASADGHALALGFALQVDAAAGSASGTVAVTPA
jgi:sulfoxide reductase heme-binding subunit YedZ